jgi:parvulin-like peptidyl-prolyl isomerase
VNIITRIRSAVAAWYGSADKGVLTNFAFLSAISLSAVLLLGVVGVSWWTDNLSPAVEVNGSSISVGEARARGSIESLRLTLQAERIRARVAAGTMTSEAGDAALQQLNDSGTNLSTKLTSDMIDSLLVKDLAISKGVAIDQAAADIAWAQEAMTPELRLLRRITITIEPNGEAAALKRADGILAKLRDGADFGTVAKQESSDSFALDGGRVGWSSQDEDPMTDPAYIAAWALTAPGLTDVITQSSGQYAIILVDQIRPTEKDEGFELRISDANIDLGLYQRMVTEEALTEALAKVVTAELLVGPVEQRDVSYATVALPTDGTDVEEVLARHILYSPNDDSNGASKLSADDPAWAAAEAEANAAIDAINAGTPMADLASASDDTSSGNNGGLLGWAPKGAYVPAFEDAVWADGLTAGSLLGPVKTEFGYHVIQFEARRAPLSLRMGALAADLAVAGTEFNARAEQAKTEIDGLESGDVGFVSKYSINPDLASAAWSVNTGEVGPLVTLTDRLLIIRVNAVEQRELTPAQITAINASGFYSWLGEYRSSAAIKIDGQTAQEVGPTPSP